MRHILTWSFLCIGLSALAEDPHQPNHLKLVSPETGRYGVKMDELERPVMTVNIDVKLDAKGDGKGTLSLDPNGYPQFDEVGERADLDRKMPALPITECEVTLKYLKSVKRPRPPVLPAAPAECDTEEQTWKIYSVSGPKLKSRLTFACADYGGTTARLMVHRADKSVQFAITLSEPLARIEPCHPGCFPEGTPIRVSRDTIPIESLKVSDEVTTMSLAGVSGRSRIESIFVTRNRLIEVHTEEGKLTTTETQPMAIPGGRVMEAGKLQAGDQILRWNDGDTKSVKVVRITPTHREAKVLNLVVGDKMLFIADGYLVRGKPPIDSAQDTRR